MKAKILISVVIPSYNRAETVGQTIDSILAQKVDANIEMVIGDDCSTDNAREVLLRYKEQHPDTIKLLFHEQNMGLGANWATCVKACKGKYICNCDNDDYWHNEHKLQIQLDYMETHPECNICVTDYVDLNQSIGKTRYRKTIIDKEKDLQLQMWSPRDISNATFMYRADFMKAHLDLDEFIKRRFTLQDWPAWVILTAYTSIYVIPIATATVRVGGSSVSRPNSVEKHAKQLDGDKEICRYLGELFPEKFPYTDEMWDAYQNKKLLSIAYLQNDYASAKKYGKLCHTKNWKKICSQNFILFHLFCRLKRIKNQWSNTGYESVDLKVGIVEY